MDIVKDIKDTIKEFQEKLANTTDPQSIEYYEEMIDYYEALLEEIMLHR